MRNKRARHIVQTLLVYLMHIFKIVDFTAFEGSTIIYQHFVFLNKGRENDNGCESNMRESGIVNRESL